MKINPRLQMLITMMLFGTIGTFGRLSGFPSATLTVLRSAIGFAVLALILLVKKRRLDLEAIKKRLGFIILGGALMGTTWVFIFETYKYTTVAIGTLLHYMSPIFMLLGAALIFREKISPQRAVCLVVAVLGMCFLSGIVKSLLAGEDIGKYCSIKGTVIGLCAAFFYGSFTLVRRTTADVPALDATLLQLLVATVCIFPYAFLTGDFARVGHPTFQNIIFVILIGVFDTGIGFALYFDCFSKMRPDVFATMCYIDPIEACMLSIFLLGEKADIFVFIGAAMIILATFFAEVPVGQARSAFRRIFARK